MGIKSTFRIRNKGQPWTNTPFNSRCTNIPPWRHRGSGRQNANSNATGTRVGQKEKASEERTGSTRSGNSDACQMESKSGETSTDGLENDESGWKVQEWYVES